ISTATRDGIKELINEIIRILPTIEKDEYIKVEHDDDTKEELVSDFDIFKNEDNEFEINNKRIIKLLSLTDVYDDRALNRFMKIITGAGVIEKLKELNAKEGETVKVGDFKFDYYPDEDEVK
ncbi:MAG: Obg family GTPase CgtA, partial [Cyanobacteriota bacterium]